MNIFDGFEKTGKEIAKHIENNAITYQKMLENQQRYLDDTAIPRAISYKCRLFKFGDEGVTIDITHSSVKLYYDEILVREYNFEQGLVCYFEDKINIPFSQGEILRRAIRESL